MSGLTSRSALREMENLILPPRRTLYSDLGQGVLGIDPRRTPIIKIGSSQLLQFNLVKIPTRALAATYDPLSNEDALGLGDDRALSFRLAVRVEEDHDPIPGSLQVMGSRGVRKHGREVPGVSFSMQDR